LFYSKLKQAHRRKTVFLRLFLNKLALFVQTKSQSV